MRRCSQNISLTFHLLLTHGDLDSRTRYQNAKNTLERLLECKHVVPVINENDSVAVEELRFGGSGPPLCRGRDAG